MTGNVAKCLLVSKVLVADGMMTDTERTFLDEMMTRLALTDAERRQVIELEGWDLAEPIVQALSTDDKQALIEELFDAASADGRLSPHESEAIKQVTRALGL